MYNINKKLFSLIKINPQVLKKGYQPNFVFLHDLWAHRQVEMQKSTIQHGRGELREPG